MVAEVYHEPLCVGEKVCVTCGVTKRVLAFSAAHQNADGLCSWCRDCAAEKDHEDSVRQAACKPRPNNWRVRGRKKAL